MDTGKVWSATSCAKGGRIIVPGSTLGGRASLCAAATSSYPFRCCADADSASPTGSPTHPPTPTPARSRATCTALGWPRAGGAAAGAGERGICFASHQTPLPGCSGLKLWASARDFCASAGARLCTAGELGRGAGLGTGCGYDRPQSPSHGTDNFMTGSGSRTALVWSSEPCHAPGRSSRGSSMPPRNPPWGYFAVTAGESGGEPICLPAAARRGHAKKAIGWAVARCCADD